MVILGWGWNRAYPLGEEAVSRRGHDRHGSHSESSLLAVDLRSSGGHWLVLSQLWSGNLNILINENESGTDLMAGTKYLVGSRDGLWLRYQKLHGAHGGQDKELSFLPHHDALVAQDLLHLRQVGRRILQPDWVRHRPARHLPELQEPPGRRQEWYRFWIKKNSWNRANPDFVILQAPSGVLLL